jgi:hypothetical protein
MSKHIARQIDIQHRMVERISTLLCTTVDCRRSQAAHLAEYTRALNEMPKGVTRYVREYLRGYHDRGLRQIETQHVVFCYDVRGQRYAIDSDEYRELLPSVVSERHSWCGFCWRADTSRVWFAADQPKKEELLER